MLDTAHECLVRHRNVWYGPRMFSAAQECLVRHKNVWCSTQMFGIRHKNVWCSTLMYGAAHKRIWCFMKLSTLLDSDILNLNFVHVCCIDIRLLWNYVHEICLYLAYRSVSTIYFVRHQQKHTTIHRVTKNHSNTNGSVHWSKFIRR